VQNIVKIDVSTDTILSISTVYDESNSITIKFTNCTVNDTPPEVEFYKPEKYCGCITFDTSQQEYAVDVPDECIGDGHIFHFRYICDNRAHKYFHILGNANAYESMTLKQLTGNVMTMEGSELSTPNISFLDLLLKLLTREKLNPTDKNCYRAGLELYQSLESDLIEKGTDTSECITIKDLIDKLLEYYRIHYQEYYGRILSDIYEAIASRGLIFPKENIEDYDDQIRKLKMVDLVIEFSEVLRDVNVTNSVGIIGALTDHVSNVLLVPGRTVLSESLASENLAVAVSNSVEIIDTLIVSVSHDES